MAGLPVARANVLANSELGESPSAARVLRLYTVAPTATSSGTEVSGGGYAAQTITFGANDSSGTSHQSADINFPANTGALYNIVAWAVTDSAGTNMYVFMTFGSLAVATGSIVQFLVASNPISVQYQ